MFTPLDQLIDHLAFMIADQQQVPGIVGAEHHLALAPELFEELKDQLADLVVRRRLELGWVDSADDGRLDPERGHDRSCDIDIAAGEFLRLIEDRAAPSEPLHAHALN